MRARSRQIPAAGAVTLRFGFPDDERALARLATLDSSAPPAPPVLVAEVAGELHAALSLASDTVVADPFHPTAELVELLLARASQLSAAERSAGIPRRNRPWARLGLAGFRAGASRH